MPVSSWHVRTRLVVGAATFFDGVDALAIAYVLPVLVDGWRLSPQLVGILIGAGYAGQLVGAILFGWMAERIGRLSTLVYTVTIYSVLSLFCAASWNYSSLLVFRTIQGLGLGGEVPVAAAYIGEVARARGRGRFFLMYEQVYVVGRVVAALLGVWVVTRLGWRSIFLLGGLSSFLVFVLRRFLYESPRWLASRGRLKEADRILNEIESRILSEGKSLGPLESSGIRQSGAATDWREPLRGIYRTRTLTTWALWFSAYLIMNGLSTWVPTLYRTIFRLPVQTSLNYGLVSTLAGFAGCLLVALLIDWTGRRLWFSTAFLLAAAACAALWWLGASSAASVLVFASITTFFINSNAMLVFLHTAEVYPTRMRALATSVASAWMRLASILGPVLIGLTIGHYPLATVFLEFCAVAVVGSVVAGLLTVETKARVLEEISP
jgi:putative MFS transporter